MKHMFITIEGVDGVGKTTVVRMLATRLGATPIKTPDERLSAERKLIERKGSAEDKYVFYLRSLESQQDEIRALLKNGSIICDRYIHSTVAYHWPETELLPSRIDECFPSFVMPDRAILLTLSGDVARERITWREQQTGVVSASDHNLALQERARRRFLSMPELIRIDTGDITPEQVCDLILERIAQ